MAVQRIGACQGKYKHLGPQYKLSEGGLGARLQKNYCFEVCSMDFWGSSMVNAYSTYMYIPFTLLSEFSGIRKYNVRNSSGLQSSDAHVHYNSKFTSAAKIKQSSRLSWNQWYSETNNLEELNWDVNDEPALIY